MRLTQWPNWFSLAEFWFNTSYNSAPNISPFQALYGNGIDPPLSLKGTTIPSKVEDMNKLTQESGFS